MKSKSVVQINKPSSKASRARNSVMGNGGKWGPCTVRPMTASELYEMSKKVEKKKEEEKYLEMHW